MVEFFAAQVDYILFINGLTFLFMGMMTYILGRQAGPMPWKHLAFFAGLQGFHALLEMLALAWGGRPSRVDAR